MSEGGFDQTTQGPQGPSGPTPKKEQKGGEQRAPPKSPLLPDRESQSEERKSVIDAVRQITGAHKETPAPGGIGVGDTPEYDWDTRYDGIQGFPSHLKNRVSEPSTPQRGQSPRRRPKTPPQPQRPYKQLKVYDETPTGRPLPTLQQIRQANCIRSSRKRVLTRPMTSVKIPVMITEIVPKKHTWSLKMLGRTWKQKGHLKTNAQTVIVHTRGFALVHGVINLVILHKTV